MRKITLIVLIGLLTLFGSMTYAETMQSFVGKTIEGQFPVTVDGEKIDQPGLVVDGISYLPVRTIGELIGCDISFIDKEIHMDCEEEKVSSGDELVEIGDDLKFVDVSDEQMIKGLEGQKKDLELFIQHYEKVKARENADPEQLEKMEDALDNLRTEIAEKEAELTRRGVDYEKE